MPKLKTRKSAAKRFSISGRGKVLRTRSDVGHGTRKKRASALRERGEMRPVTRTEAKKIKRLLPYGAT